MADKKITPREAALAVLNKAHELYKNSTLAKSEDPLSSVAGDRAKRAANYKEQGAPISQQIATEGAKDSHKERLAGIKAAPKPDLGKSDGSGANPDQAADAQLGEKVEQDVHQHEAQNEDPAHAMPMKGHLKLAKFMGRMEHKKEQKAKEMQKMDGMGAPAAAAPTPAAPVPPPMAKSESKHDRCVKDVKENSPDVKNPHAVCVSEGVKPASWSK